MTEPAPNPRRRRTPRAQRLRRRLRRALRIAAVLAAVAGVAWLAHSLGQIPRNTSQTTIKVAGAVILIGPDGPMREVSAWIGNTRISARIPDTAETPDPGATVCVQQQTTGWPGETGYVLTGTGPCPE